MTELGDRHAPVSAIAMGEIRTDAWDAKFAEPVFKPGAFPELQSLDYRYKYTREVRDPQTGQLRPTTFWHRETIDATTWTVYEDVEVSAALEPTWRALEPKPHGLGFVPAVWFAIGERGTYDFDGTGSFAPYLDLLDEMNYTASQAGRSLYYNLDPQTVLSGVADGDLDALLKGGRNTWCLPAKAEAKLLESNGSYIVQARERLELLKKSILDAAGVVLPDPDRVAGAQSGASLELLAAPQIAKVDSLREDVGDAFVRLLEQVLVAMSSPGLSPDKARIDVRDGKPRSDAALGRVVLSWGAHFPLTATDAQSAATAVKTAVDGGTLSRAAGARYLARYFSLADVEADQKLVQSDEAHQDRRVHDLDARRRWADGMDYMPPHLRHEIDEQNEHSDDEDGNT